MVDVELNVALVDFWQLHNMLPVRRTRSGISELPGLDWIRNRFAKRLSTLQQIKAWEYLSVRIRI